MKIGITHRLFLAMLAAAVMAVISMVVIMTWSVDRGFLRYVNAMEQRQIDRLAAELEKRFAAAGNWDFLRREPAMLARLVAESLPAREEMPFEPGPPGPLPGDGMRPPPPPERMVHHLTERLLILDARREHVLPVDFSGDVAELKALRYKGAVAGYLGLAPRRKLSEAHQLRFIREQKLAVALVAGVVVCLAAGLSLLVAKRLVRPIRDLAGATGQLAAGRFDTRIPVASSDELGHLARDFNALALTLEKNEQARRQWVADISHELRTPLAVLRGEIEAIQDGVRQPSPDSIRSLHGEVLRLNRLVDDLYQLSLTDIGALAYRKEPLDLGRVLVGALVSYRAEFAGKGIAVREEISVRQPITVFGDAERLQQLFVNLLDNVLKYTDIGGELLVRLTCHDGAVTVDLQDSVPGVPEEALGMLFERLYRVEGSRSRARGGAGLGLAICRNIVEAHNGTITARYSPLGGVWIAVTLPVGEHQP
ncbi:HAMP domain-containing protein [Geobacter sulfurreducens]|uniref:histidine kinase n=1 Tax=Geobacter sulfurreducens (strain ATCC 51573 / DSM 12127 / PCA) TaxID=243231 RepID=Q747Z6_GEOSL|nr:ATP-binding protein [Geobacter sulfurreducens]AAR36510.2 sensor histidine kinase, HAMP domain-containing [Geobacter sulfurreducens PCA]AJY69358.1 histidine kinase [Geobacter sulfurreducens]QVW34913.1 HAMP domain-containing protein [Geobacter sulfurreducens]UAC03784.1 HAMP domain-containing protein [Geobacter sulfurreducens]HCD95378.1 HAMP domain-containing protein [Geobacter sulfurreducens]